MYKFDLRLWNHRVRKTVILALTLPLLAVMQQAPVAQAGVTTISAPQEVTVVANPGTLDITWSAPVTGSGSVTGYRVEYSTDGSTWTTATSTLASSARAYGLSGLTVGTSYYVRVAGIYASGNAPYGYPWKRLYSVTNPIRNNNATRGIDYTNDSRTTYSASSFTRVRYRMQYYSSSGTVLNYVNADFNKWSQKTSNQYDGGGTYTTPAASIANLNIPAPDNQFIIQADVTDLNVESSQTALNDSNVSGRLELWPFDYNVYQNTSLLGTDGGGSNTIFDSNDRPSSNTASQYGSFQVHDMTNGGRTVLAWNAHYSTTPDIGIGNSSCGNGYADWTFCGSAAGVTQYNTTNRSNFKLETFINIPTTFTSPQLTFNSNSPNSGSVPSAIINYGNVTLPGNTGSLAKTGFSFAGWNTAADGSGTRYLAGATFNLTANTTLYAQWASTISYNGNTATSTRTIESTTALTTVANTTLSTGKLAQGTVVSSGLLFNMNAADSSSVVGNVWYDANRNGVTATAFGSPTYNSSQGYFQLNGTSQYLNLGSTVLPSSGVTPFTASVMFKADKPNLTDQAIFAKYQDYVGGHFIIRTTADSKIRAWRDVNGDLPYSSVYNGGDVNYGTVTYDGTNYKLYLNGVLQSSRAWGTTNSFTVDTILGARGYGTSVSTFFQGRIYSAQGYSRALTEAEVLQNYNALLPNQTVSKNGFTLGQWNTEANGTGTQYESSTVIDLDALKTPYLRLKPENYSVSGSTKTWSATNGTSISDGAGATIIKGTPVLNLSGGASFGATATFPTLSGDTSAGIKFGNATLPTYTFCGVARYKGTPTSLLGTQRRIFASPDVDWITGFYQNGMGANHHASKWVTSYVTTTLDVSWHYFCDSGNRTMWDGTFYPTENFVSHTSLPGMTINYGYEGQTSDWEVAEIVIYDEYLPSNQIDYISRYFKNRYGLATGATAISGAATLKPVTNYAATGDRTLQAQWVSTITYDGNGNDKGRVPATHIIKNSSGTLATNVNNLTKGGHKLVGWNTAANGTGARYALGATYANLGNVLLYAQWSKNLVFPQALTDPNSLAPYSRFQASDYTGTTTWIDSSGNGRNATVSGTLPTSVTKSAGDGVTKSFKVVDGVPASKIAFNNPYMPDGNYTLFHVARYDGGTSGRIFNSANDNWLSGYHWGNSGVKHYDAWATTESNRYGQNWVLFTDYSKSYRANGTSIVVDGGGVDDFGPLTVNTYTQASDFNIAEVIIYDRRFTLDEMRLVEDYLADKYGFSGYTNYGTYLTTSSLSVAATVGGRSDTFTATNGYGNKTFSISPTVSGITLDTSTANAAAIVVSGLVPIGTYVETITATDQAGFTSAHTVTISVAEQIKWSSSNSTSLITTVGETTSARLYFTGGLSGKVATITKPTNVPLGGITIDTSTLTSAGYVTLNISAAVLPGTYSLTMSITDDTKRVSNQIISLTVNNLPALTFTSGISDTTTTVTTNGLWLQYEIGKSWAGVGTSVKDLTGNNADAGMSTGAVYSATFGGGSVTLSGTKLIWLDTGVIAPTDSLSKFYWIYPTAATGTIVTVCSSGCPYHESELEMLNGRLYARVWNLGSVASTETITTNAWHYVGYIYDRAGGNTYIYIDGRLAGSVANSGTRGPPDGVKQYDGISVGDSQNMVTSANGQFSFGAAHYYKRVLSAEEVFFNYASSAPRYLGTNFPGRDVSGSATITTTQGVSATYNVFTATSGTGNKTFTLSSGASGISLDTSSTNLATLNLASSLAATNSTTARVINETVTATDSTTAVTKYRLTITVNPPITITPTIANTITTTFGVATSDTFTAAYGTGTLRFSHTPSSNASAFTLRTTSSTVAVLSVSNTLPAGTYLDTITVTDSASAVTNYVLTIVVNPAMTLSAAGSSTVTTTITKSAFMRVNIAYGTGAKTLTISSPATGITLDSSTVGSGYVTINVGSTVPANTYSVTLNIRDSTGATASGNFTVVVNKAPKITGPSAVTNGLELNFDAGNSASYSGAGTTWNSTVGGKSVTLLGTSGLPTYSSDSGGLINFNSTNLATQKHYAAGSISNTTLTSYTVEAWAKFASLPTGEINALVSDKYQTKINYELFYGAINVGNCVGVGLHISHYNGGWGCSKAVTGIAINTWYHIVGTYDSMAGFKMYLNGVLQSGASATSSVAASSDAANREIYIAKRHDASDQFFPGAIPVVRVYNRALTATEALQNYNAIAYRYVNAASGNDSITVTSGRAAAVTGVIATDGTGNKTFALSGLNSAISISTPAANQFTLSLGENLASTDSATARTYYETVTATDSTTAFTTLSYSILVNPPVRLVATSSSLSTTSGVAAYDTFTATYGTGNKTFALTGSPTTSGFTLTQANNVAVLKVERTANPGTYYETVTATDSLGATKAVVVTVVVMPPPSVVGVSRIVTTQGVSYTSPIFNISGGTGALTMSLVKSPSNSQISLSGTSSAGGYLLIGSTSETGTYLATIRVTDSLGSYSELPVTVVVNAPVTLSGSLSIEKTYGVATSNGYSTNGSGTAPFIFSATPVCAVYQSTADGYTYERINGTDSCTWTAPVGVTTVDALLVGAGGGGGPDGGAGGGGGSLNTLTSVTLPANRQLSVQVGAGGTGGIWGGTNASSGADTSISNGSATYAAPGGAGGGGCGSVGAAGGTQGSGGTALAGSNGGYGANNSSSCDAGTGSAGANGKTSNFLGSVTYGGGGGGGPWPNSGTTVGPNAGGSGGGGAGAASNRFPILGLAQYFRSFSTTPTSAVSKEAFTTGTCGAVIGNINYSTDSDFPCADKENFQGYATGYFIAPVTGNIEFYLYSDDSSALTINVNGTETSLTKSGASNEYLSSGSLSGFVAGNAYPISVFFTEIGGIAAWKLEYSYSGQTRTPIPVAQLRSSDTEGLIQYFRSKSSPENAVQKTEFTTGACGIKVGNIPYAQDSEFPCAAKDNFQGYASGYFIAPYTGSIKFYLSSDDSSYLTINVNGTDQNLSRPCCSESDATWSGFVRGQLYPIKVFFTEDGGLASWKLKYEYDGQAKIEIPVSQLRPNASFTAPVAGTNGSGGGGGGGSAGTYKLTGAKGGSGVAILKYLTPSETATETMITAIVNRESSPGLLTLNVPAKVNVGTYTETITVQDAANSAPYQAVVTIKINKATPTVALSLPGAVTTMKYGNPVQLTATSSTPGRVNFKFRGSNISTCLSVQTVNNIATCDWEPWTVGSQQFDADFAPTDSNNYESATAQSTTYLINKADTLTVTAGVETLVYTASTGVVARPFSTTGLVDIDTINSVSMVYTGTANDGTSWSSTTAPTKAGIYVATPNYPTSTSAIAYVNTDSTVAGRICRMVPPGTLECTGGDPVLSSYYESITVVAGTLTINRAPNTSSLIYPTVNTNSAVTTPPASNYITFKTGLTDTPTTTSRLGNGLISYATSSSANCSVDSSTAVMSLIQAGSCVVQMTVAQGDDYLADSATATIEIAKGNRTIALTSPTSSLKYTETATVTTTISDGALDGGITYSLNSSPGCSFDSLGGILTATSGTLACTLNVTIAEGTNFLTASSASALALSIAKADAPIITMDTVTAVDYIPGTRAAILPSYQITGFKGSDAASLLTLTYSFVSNPFESFSYSDTRTPIDAGTYRITPSAMVMSSGLDTNYETPNYSAAAVDFTINRITQDLITIDGINGEVNVPFTLVYRGGNNPTGTPTFTKVSGTQCVVNGNELNASEAGLCVVTVTVPANRNYLATTSDSITIRVRNFTLVPVFIFGNGTTGISIAPNTPLTVGETACTTGCVPTLTAISPYEGAEGDVITLTGSNFTGAIRVIFNVFTNATTFNVDSDTQISVQIPGGLTVGDGTIEVVTPGGITARWFDFGVLP